jgi:RNA polymerase sigma-70 factor, ECF subfamily
MATVDVFMTGRMVGGFAICAPEVAAPSADSWREVYQANYQRIYCLAFWMTDNELAAEEATASAFRRAFVTSVVPQPEALDRALISELREATPIGQLKLQVAEARQVLSARRNVRKVDLEHAVVQLPATERLIFLMHDVEGYEHARIARLIGLSEEESIQGLHQARLRVRELLASK